MAREIKSSILLESRADTQGFEKFNREATRSRAAAESTSKGFSVMGSRLQSAGYQVQDFAVQVQGGTSAMTALSQQGSQFLGSFGTGGAIAGAVLTVGILTARILGSASAAKEAAKQTEALSKAQRELFLARKDFRFEAIADDPKAQIKSLDEEISSVDSSIKNYGKSIDVIQSKIRKITIASPTGAFAVKFGKGGEFKELQAGLAAFQTRVAEAEKERIELSKQRGAIVRSVEKEEKDQAKKATEELEANYKKRADFIYDLEKRNLAARAKMAEEVRAREMAREEKEYSKSEQAARDHASKIDAIEKRDRNEYQRRGLQLGAAQELGQVPQLNRPEPVQFITPTPAMIAPNNAGREDQRVPSLLNSIDATLKLISRKETALA